MKYKIFLLFLFLSSISTTCFSQKEKIIEGSWENLQGITQYSLVFNYSDLKVNRYESEEAFKKDMIDKFDEVGYGSNTYEETWINAREKRYEPKFITSFNLRFDDKEVYANKGNERAEYVMKVHTTHIVTGFTNGTMHKASKVDAVISIYKKDAPDTVLLKVKYTRAQGNNAMPFNITPGYTVAESYAKLAKTFATRIKRKVL